MKFDDFQKVRIVTHDSTDACMMLGLTFDSK
jgi:hypothetical protein